MTTDSNENGHFSSSYSLESSDQTREHYKSWAKTYDLEIGEQNQYAQPKRAALMLQRFEPNNDIVVLDAGCGSGLSGQALHEAGYTNLHGCDFSSDMLKIAKEKAIYATLAEVDLNSGQPNIADETYGAVCAVGVFSFGHVSPNACDDLLRILKPCGHLIIALNEKFWDKGDLKAKLDELMKSDRIEVLKQEYGEHLPGQNVKGWVIAARKL